MIRQTKLEMILINPLLPSNHSEGKTDVKNNNLIYAEALNFIVLACVEMI